VGSETGVARLAGDDPADRVFDGEPPDRCAYFARVGEADGDLSCQIGASPGRDDGVDQNHRMGRGDLQEAVGVILADAGTHQQYRAALRCVHGGALRM